jgi:hypothetical protein
MRSQQKTLEGDVASRLLLDAWCQIDLGIGKAAFHSGIHQ